MDDLFAAPAAVDFVARAVVPARELGAYEALWAREGTSFKSLARLFGRHPGALPSDFVAPADAERYSRAALASIRAAGIRRFGIRVHRAGEYPARLRDALHPVELLYFQGNWDLTSSRCVSVVGTRRPTAQGVRRAAQLARRFVEAGFTVVSGLAQGIDTVAHETALAAGGNTVAVLGTPITCSYPPANGSLQRRIADGHLVISQVPIVRHSRQSPRGNRLFFPERNVTMSALTEATVIVEAGNTSGTLIQGRNALLQQRKLFILDSCFHNPCLTWPAKFIERGAIRVGEFEEIRAQLAA